MESLQTSFCQPRMIQGDRIPIASAIENMAESLKSQELIQMLPELDGRRCRKTEKTEQKRQPQNYKRKSKTVVEIDGKF